MKEYIVNGTRMAWLLDPETQQVHIYREGLQVEIKENPKRLSGEAILPNFELSLDSIFTGH